MAPLRLAAGKFCDGINNQQNKKQSCSHYTLCVVIGPLAAIYNTKPVSWPPSSHWDFIY